MNTNQLYAALYMAETIARHYSGNDSYIKNIGNVKRIVSEENYRLAVIGEFNRGKSSLINALIGTELLPTDILPETAVINRIVYGERRQICIYYNNGKKKRKTVQELEAYATRKGGETAEQGICRGIKEKEIENRKAPENQELTIREILVEYPSVFCRQNRIEIIDTPGLNENEQMDEKTLSVLGEIDSAIVTIHANMLLSLTEEEIILTLIREQNVHHITFVITFIDQVRGGKKEQDMIIAYIKNHISGKILSQAREIFADEPELVQKAEEILGHPRLFAVSSTLALKGFLYDNEQFLEESRFPQFKRDLVDLLTVDQSADMYSRTLECLRGLNKRLESWENNLLQRCELELGIIIRKRELRERYKETVQNWIQKKMLEMDEQLEKEKILRNDAVDEEMSENLKQKIFKCYVKYLSSLRADNFSKAGIRSVLLHASEESMQMMRDAGEMLEMRVCRHMERLAFDFSRFREQNYMERPDWEKRFENWKRQNTFPKFTWTDAAEEDDALMNGEIILLEKERVEQVLTGYNLKIRQYMNAFRKMFFIQIAADQRQIEDEKSFTAEEQMISEIQMRRKSYETQYREDKQNLEKCLEDVLRMEATESS